MSWGATFLQSSTVEEVAPFFDGVGATQGSGNADTMDLTSPKRETQRIEDNELNEWTGYLTNTTDITILEVSFFLRSEKRG